MKAVITALENTKNPHSRDYEETVTSGGSWDRSGRSKITNIASFGGFEATYVTLL